MSEPTTRPPDAGEDTSLHDHVRTDGEIGVDDALGTADDPEG